LSRERNDETPVKRASGVRWGAVVAATCLVVASLVAPSTRLSDALVASVSIGAALAIVIGVMTHRPVRPMPWLMLALGMLGLAAASAAWSDAYSNGDLVYPGLGEAVALLAYPALFVGAIGITSRQRGARDLLVGAEPVIYAIALTALVWLAVMEPWFDRRQLPADGSVWVWMFVGLDVLLALVAWRRVDKWGSGRAVLLLLSGAFVAMAGAHALVGWQRDAGSMVPGSLAAVSLIVGPAVIALAALLPSMASTPHVAEQSLKLRWSQVISLSIAALVPLGAMVLMLVVDEASSVTVTVISASTVGVVVLSLNRMWGLVNTVRELTERQGHDRLAAMVEHSSDVVLLADRNGIVSFASPGLQSTLGHQPAEWVGRHLVDIVADEERGKVANQLRRLLETGSGNTVEFEATLLRVDGHRRRANVVIANLLASAAVDGIVATFRDITDQRNLERQLSHRAYHDELTGLANRALFLDRMDHALRVARSEHDPVVVLFVDLDDFKGINDALGHEVGDKVLMSVAACIRKSAGAGDTAARLGGDEFAILLEDVGGTDRAIDVAERLLKFLRVPVAVTGYDLTVLASIGVAVATPNMNTTSLLRDADIAMYEAKRAGKGQIRIFDPAMRMIATRQLEYRTDLGDALAEGQLRLVYMPFVDLRSGEVRGAEALVRWHHPRHGDVSPLEFVPIAEHTGHIVPIGHWVLEEALKQVAGWRPDAGLFISVNVSPVQVRQPDFVDRVTSALERHRVEPGMLMIEMTESVLVGENERAADTVTQLREHGVRIAIDDFGAGYCSLTYLQRHPVDMIKIDRSVVEELGGVPLGNTLARTILQMAGSLDLHTAAEGIETTGQLHELRRLGCDLGQGYLLSRPLETDDLARRFGGAASIVSAIG
jgi:diguanylate cyclase (GGDEF)-like protein/PAS domain S-box-containing protein